MCRRNESATRFQSLWRRFVARSEAVRLVMHSFRCFFDKDSKTHFYMRLSTQA
jgi:hypothetical protein